MRRLALIAALAGAGCTSRSDSDLPIIVISIDALRADHLGCYGYERATSPAIDRFAAEGILFARAYAPVGETNPSFASMWSGRQPSGHGIDENKRQIAPGVPLLAEILAKAGYATAAFSSNPVLRHTGLESGFGTFVYTDEKDRPHDAWDESLVRQASAWIETHRGDPFLLWVHFMEPHQPYQPAPPWDRKFLAGYDGPIDGSAESLADLMLQRIPATPEAMARVTALYDGQVAATDARVGRILDALRANGLYDRAAIFVLADHGEELGDHHLYLYHSASVYEGVLRIPFVARIPGRDPSRQTRRRVPEIVRMADFLPSVLGLLEIPFDRSEIDGESWIPLLDVDPPAEVRGRFSSAISEHHRKIFTIRTDTHRYVYNPDGFTPPAPPFPGPWERQMKPELRGYPEFTVAREELYDLVKDPREVRDIARDESAKAEELRKRILAYLKERVMRSGPEAVGEATIQRLIELGYINRGKETAKKGGAP
ncbi:MAG: sulfatase [Planctomycetes bacterium]|nr:sulfatase [Planctomycetota bacterium]